MAYIANEVAEEILNQLGGREFVAVTGVKSLSTDNGDNLKMTLPKNMSGANRLEITLDYGTDTYTMRFYKYTPLKVKVSHNRQTAEVIPENVKEIRLFSDVYCDQLQGIFTEVTGFDTRMPRIIGMNS